MILKVENLGISFGTKRVLSGISFTVAEGETLALMGPNGAGKTTVLRCALGLLRYQGKIEVGGRDARREGVPARRQIGYVPQSPAFYNTMTAREFVSFMAGIRNAPRREVVNVLKQVGLSGDADRFVHVFSGGMRQRLSLAVALLGEPPLILLDEPTANLDPPARAELLKLLHEFKAAGKTLIISSHRSQEVRGLSTRVIFMRDGKIEKQGSPEDVLPQEHMVLSIHAPSGEEKKYLGLFLAAQGLTVLPPYNGVCEARLSLTELMPVVERLRKAGVREERIDLRLMEEGEL